MPPPFAASPHAPLLRLLDITLALAVLAFAAPLMLIIFATIYMHDRGGPVFAHRRYGYQGRTFLCFKFRSMSADAEGRLSRLLARNTVARAEWDRDHKLRRDPRVTTIGGFLRRTSLDELPQLFNVLKGEMSLVGPRPIVAAEVHHYGRRFRAYCSVRPGITGLWQISGRNDAAYRRRVAMDSILVRRMTPALYARILVGTVRSVVMQRGAY